MAEGRTTTLYRNQPGKAKQTLKLCGYRYWMYKAQNIHCCQVSDLLKQWA